MFRKQNKAANTELSQRFLNFHHFATDFFFWKCAVMEIVGCRVSFSLIAFTFHTETKPHRTFHQRQKAQKVALAHKSRANAEIHKVTFAASIAHKLTVGEIVMSTE